MNLSTGASLITLSLLINKLAGFYGILALFTGYHLSGFQLSMYVYSVLGLVLTAYLAPFIRKQTPLQCLALAWFYVLDSVINAAYTAAFAVTWFLVLVQHDSGKSGGGAKGPGHGMMDDTSGFTSPEMNVSRVEVVANPAADRQDNVVAAGVVPADGPAGSGIGDGVLGTESMNSIGVIVMLWTIRAYFCLIILAWARMVLRQHIASSTNGGKAAAANAETGMVENPFEETKPQGQGWRGKLGRAMVSIGRSYWLGSDEDDSWMQGMKFRNSTEFGTMLNKIETQSGAGLAERERRRRAGTGPPLPGAGLDFAQGKEDAKTPQVPAQKL
ncbi:hypothetical protein PV08_01679 [Exophiala spinifera]|uniref:DUF1753-domain-containing protein n=1 Tax=Exophiala spinifera TaxID=91928 RepID=A0A0D2BRS2_9EURO|nr:uncharacterized protein PV08_01679 [Exophiala spinifera]KIW21100.1 hypothetical protein PV08_01679 [Exophiala spinifera]